MAKSKARTFATAEARDRDKLRRAIVEARKFENDSDLKDGWASTWRFGISGGMLELAALEQLQVRFSKRTRTWVQQFPYSVTPGAILKWIERQTKPKGGGGDRPRAGQALQD
jgi:hypothetical protein